MAGIVNVYVGRAFHSRGGMSWGIYLTPRSSIVRRIKTQAGFITQFIIISLFFYFAFNHHSVYSQLRNEPTPVSHKISL